MKKGQTQGLWRKHSYYFWVGLQKHLTNLLLLFLEWHPQAGQRAVGHGCLLQECSFQWLWGPQPPSGFLWDVIVHREQSSETSSGIWYVCSALAEGHPMSQSPIKWQLVVTKHEAPQSHRSQAVMKKGIFCRQFTLSQTRQRSTIYSSIKKKVAPITENNIFFFFFFLFFFLFLFFFFSVGNSFILHNIRHLSRIYPAGWRTDSSNYNPVDLWNVGCQIGGCNGELGEG